MIYWNYLLVAAALFILFLFYNEWKRKNKARLFGRLVASLLAVASLLFMAYPYARHTNDAASKKVIVLTAGFIKDSVDNFIQQSNAKIPLYADADDQSKIDGLNAVQLVTDWSAFAHKRAEDTIHVFGNGLTNETLALINPHPIVFHASAAKTCITHIYWKQNLQTGESLAVQGQFENNSSNKIKIVLKAFGAAKDSFFVNAFTNTDFVLRSIPLHTGRAVYSLIAVGANDTLEEEPIPVNVQAAEPLKLLIISSSPDFENTFLKNNLSQQGYQVTVNTTISTNKSNKQFLNTPQQSGNNLTASYLSKFDVLLADEEALEKVNANTLAAIRSVVSDNGTGLLVKLDAEKNINSFYSALFPVKKIQDEKEFFLLHETVADSNRYKIKITDPLRIVYTQGTQTLLQDQQSNTLAAAVVYGNGKIVATTLQNTFSMALAGDRNLYQQLWWLLLHKVAKKLYATETWQTNPFTSFQNNSVELFTENNLEELSKAVLASTNVYLMQDALLPFQWHAKYWPAETGWQQLPQLNKQAGYWYVYQPKNWQPLLQHNLLTATKKYASMHPVSLADIVKQQQGLSFVNWPFLLLLIFLVSCIFLWVEQKMG